MNGTNQGRFSTEENPKKENDRHSPDGGGGGRGGQGGELHR